MLILEPGSYN